MPVLPDDLRTGTATFEVVVVGAGLVGLGTARELLRRFPGCRLALVEKEHGVAAHQSGRNSGVIHSGVYYAPGSLKARLCVEGASLLTAYCDEHGIPYKRPGKLIVARNEAEIPRLEELFRRGTANSVPGLSIVDSKGIQEIEPHATGYRAIHSSGTGIVDYSQVALSLAADVRAAGGRVFTGVKVEDLHRARGEWTVQAAGASLRSRSMITCAGLHSDVLARMTGASRDPMIIPFRGDYWRLPPGRESLVRGLLYPVPDPAFPFLGVHFTPRVNGEVWLGPNAVLGFAREGYRVSTIRWRELRGVLSWPGAYRMGARYWRMGLGEIYRAVNRRALHAELRTYVPELEAGDIRRGSAGVRAQAVSRTGALVDDFVFSGEEGVLHVRNAPSPAATSCLAIARQVVDRFQDVADVSFGARLVSHRSEPPTSTPALTTGRE